MAFKIPASALTLNDEGAVGVKTITDGDIVQFTPIKIIEDQSSFVWVSGLEDNAKLVIVGQDFIVPNQKVEVVEEAKK
jgi:multidrug efflux system membrane fusion protein